jgi:hypothetical protein
MSKPSSSLSSVTRNGVILFTTKNGSETVKKDTITKAELVRK